MGTELIYTKNSNTDYRIKNGCDEMDFPYTTVECLQWAYECTFLNPTKNKSIDEFADLYKHYKIHKDEYISDFYAVKKTHNKGHRVYKTTIEKALANNIFVKNKLVFNSKFKAPQFYSDNSITYYMINPYCIDKPKLIHLKLTKNQYNFVKEIYQNGYFRKAFKLVRSGDVSEYDFLKSIYECKYLSAFGV